MAREEKHSEEEVRRVCARIRYVTANDWSSRRYLNMSRLGDTMQTTD